MIVRFVRLNLQSGKLPEFLKCFDKVKNDIRSFSGCNHLELIEEKTCENALFTYSLWDSEESLQHYLASPLFNNVWIKVKPFFSRKAEAWSIINSDSNKQN